MGFPTVIGLIALISWANASPVGFQANSYPQNQVNAWGQACRNFQQQSLQNQAAQNQYFSQHFPNFGLPPLPFVDVCSQIPSYGGGYGQSGASASGSSFSSGAGGGGFATDNRFGGNDHGGSGVHGVSVSTGSFPGGQSGTSVTHFGPGGASVSHYGGSNGFTTGNRFGGGNGGGASAGGFGGSYGGGYGGGSSFGSFGSSSGHGGGFGTSSGHGGGFGTANRFGGGHQGASATSFGTSNGGSFATASRFGEDGSNVYTAQGPHGAGISVSSTNDGHGNVHTQVHKQQY